MHKIYALFDPRTDEVRYVGQTTAARLQTRLSLHVHRAKQGARRHVCTWIRSLLRDGVRPVIVLLEETADINRERVWIFLHKLCGCNLTNASTGGESGALGVTHDAATHARMGASKRGKPKSAEHRAKIAAAHKGKPKRQPKGRKMSATTKAKIAAKARGRKASPEVRANMKAAARRHVEADPDTAAKQARLMSAARSAKASARR